MPRKIIYLLILLLIISGCNEKPEPEYEGKVIVLMYHRITPGTATDLYERSLADLEKDLQYLRDNKIRVIDFEEMGEMVTEGRAPDTDCAIITFDDGSHSWYTYARPLLIEYEMPATFFLWVEKIGMDSFLSWDEVTLMSHYFDDNGKRPFTFGSHTLYHQYLLDKRASYSTLEAYNEYLDEELGGSKKLIDPRVPGEINIMSLPFGNGYGDPVIIEAAKRNGYSFIRTSIWDAIDVTNADMFCIPSLPMLAESTQEIIGTYLGIE